MFHLLIDTCVWLDLAKDRKQSAVVSVIEEMVKRGVVTLVVPRLVVDEFRRNRDRIASENIKSMSAHFRLVKDAVGKMGGAKRRLRAVLSHLDDVNHKMPLLGAAAVGELDRIEKLLTGPPIVEISPQVKLRAAERAIQKRAPFHRGKNAMQDALLIETYADCVRTRASVGARFAFVTHNKMDFSEEHGDQRMPHRDFHGIFSRIKSLYFINLPAALRRAEPSLVRDVMFEESWMQEPRGFTEIIEAEDLLFNQVWYNRHCNRRIRIEQGEIKLVDSETYPRSPGAPETIRRDIWEGALKAARRVERQYGKKNLGPWDDFEWGMINGKLSALRWVLGDEWDMLDT